VTVAVIARDLMIATRIADAGARAGVDVRRYDDPSQLPPDGELRLVLVAWDERQQDWGEGLRAWLGRQLPDTQRKLILFGPHTDLIAHREARAAGLGPMIARSKLLNELASLLG
jgi:hypothetical protein